MDNFFYFVEALLKNHPLLSMPLVFVSGLLLSFTPCFYPLIPVILGIIGINKDTSKRKAFFLSTIYILGLSVVYTFLGIFSSLTGSIFGQFTEIALFQFIIGVILLLMGFMMLDWVHLPLRLPTNIKSKKAGYIGVFILGILSGLVVGGCTSPVLGSILTLMFFNKNIFLGGLLLFVFSLGIGLIFILVAVFGGGILDFFRKNAIISLGIKKVFGLVLLGASVYFFIRGFYLL